MVESPYAQHSLKFATARLRGAVFSNKRRCAECERRLGWPYLIARAILALSLERDPAAESQPTLPLRSGDRAISSESPRLRAGLRAS